MNDYKPRFSPPRLPIPPNSHTASTEAVAIKICHADLNWLRNSIGGGWQWDSRKEEFYVSLPRGASVAVQEFLDTHYNPLKQPPMKDGKFRLTIAPTELAALKEANLDYGQRSLVSQFFMQNPGLN